MADLDRRTILVLAGAAGVAAALPGSAVAVASPPPQFAFSTPIRIASVDLRVRNLAVTTSFYRSAVGLDVLDRTSSTVVLGKDDVPLLRLLSRPDARPARRDEAGLYHTAFLVPSRAHLGRWLAGAAENGVVLSGAADHLVSEAVYLDDPEGNGIEIYADRPPEGWIWKDGTVSMGTGRLDADGLLALSSEVGGSDGLASGTRIGHVHLKVGDVQRGTEFYGDAVGLSRTREERGDAAFLSSGGYHHHVALNVWDSPGAGLRDPEAAGLDRVVLEVRDPDALAAQGFRLAGSGSRTERVEGGILAEDPWGTRVGLVGSPS